MSVSHWTCADLESWLGNNDLTQYIQLLCVQHKIDGHTLMYMSEEDLKNPPLNITSIGDLKRLAYILGNNKKERVFPLKNNFTARNGSIHNGKIHNFVCQCCNKCYQFSNGDIDYTRVNIDSNISTERVSKNLEKEYLKTLFIFVIWIFIVMLTAFVLVVAHDRVPDRKKHPPLPDAFLDNIRRVPWAFECSEIAMMALIYMGVGVLFFHKHRLILIRRIATLWGSIFLLRCISMIITSLSVPTTHLECSEKTDGSFLMLFQRAAVVWLQGGMRLQGVRTCGDLFFSGHTTIMTLVNYFIIEYTPKYGIFRFLHAATWILNILGMFLILAGQGHYSIDVFIAFFISSQLFIHYHTLVNNRAILQRDVSRARIWFPLLAYFESKCDGMVPNEYDWPMSTKFTHGVQMKTKLFIESFKGYLSYKCFFIDSDKL